MVEATLKNIGPDTIGGPEKSIGIEFEWRNSIGTAIEWFSTSIKTSLKEGDSIRLSREVNAVPIPPTATTLLARPFTGGTIIDDPDPSNNTAETNDPFDPD